MVTSPPAPPSPSLPAPPLALDVWRQQTLNLILRVAVLVGLPQVILDSVGSVQRGHPDWALTSLAGLGMLAALTFWPRLGYRERAYGLLLLLCAFSILTTLNLGLVGAGRLYLLILVVLAAVLVERRAAVGFTALAAVPVVLTLIGMGLGLFPIPPALPARAIDPNTLLVNSLIIVVFTLLLGVVVGSLIGRLIQSLREAESALARLDSVNLRLEYLVDQRTEELRRSQALLQGIFDNSPAAVYVKDLEGRYLLTNRYMHQLYGFAADQMNGQRDSELFGDLAIPWREHERAVVATRQAVARELVTPHQDGPRTYYEIKFPLRDVTGAITAIGGIAADISDRKLAEEALARQLRLQAAVAHCSGVLLTQVEREEARDEALITALQHLLDAVHCLRAYIYETVADDGDGFVAKAVAEACAPGVTSDWRTSRLPSSFFPEALVADLWAGRTAAGTVGTLLAESPAYRELLVEAGVGSLLMMPLHVGGCLWGFLGLSDADPTGAWSDGEIQMLQTSAEMFAAFARSRQLLRSLRERDHFIQRVTDASPDVLYVFDMRQRRNVYMNREIYTLLGYTPEQAQALGPRLLEALIAPEDLARFPEHTEQVRAAADHQVVEFEYRARRADGSESWLLNREVVFARDECGRPTQMLGLARDITETREARLAIERSASQLRTISDAIPDGYIYQVVQRRDGSYVRFNYVSGGVEQLLGLTPEAIMANPAALHDTILAEDRPAVDAADLISVRDLAPFEVEARRRKADGGVGWFQMRSVPHALPDGLILWNGVCLEVTSRKETELALTRTNQSLQRRLGELGALNGIAQALMAWADLPAALRAVGVMLLPLFSAEHVAVWLREEGRDLLSQIALIGHDDVVLDGTAVRLRDAPLARSVIQARRGSVFDGGRSDPVVIAPLAEGLEALTSSALVQPLLVRGVSIGLLVVRAAEGRATFSPGDVELAQTIAGLLSSAIENGRLFQRTMVEAAQEERRRLARELHDSITQSLYSTVLLTRAWSRMVAEARPDELIDWFGQVEGIALQALKEMRLLIYQLRSPELDELGLAEALRQRLEAVEGRTGVVVHLEADAYRYPVSPEIEPQLFAIVQEALNNALRHAEARTITVTLRSDRKGVTVAVADDGQGFDPAGSSAGMGLTTMRERAEGVGGFFSIGTEPGAGTTVCVQLPPSAPAGSRALAGVPAATRRRRR